MTSTTSQRTIAVLRDLFSSYGLPEEVVSDNGPQFVSPDFTKMNGIKHTLTPPYHPASNGAADRSVQMLKQAPRKQLSGVTSLGVIQLLCNAIFLEIGPPPTPS